MASDNNSSINQNKDQSNTFSKILVIVIIFAGFITTFASGYFLARLLSIEQNITGKSAKPTSIPNRDTTPYPTSNNPQVTTKFLPGKYYSDDTIILVSKEKPQINLVASVTRAEQETNYIQSTRVSYFDGTNWTRHTDNKITQDSSIVSNSLVKSWSVTIDPTRVLKETVQGEISINNSELRFSTGVLQNEISMRSLPGYTKFMSNGTGTLSVNGKSYEVYVLYTRIYSMNAGEIMQYTQESGLTTDWLAFWDSQGNFYHVDATQVDEPTSIYQAHEIGIIEDAKGAVAKTFNVSVTRDSKNPPEQYTVTLHDPIGETLKFNRINGVNKAPGGSYTWYLGNIEGTVQKADGEILSGIGVVEYIKH